MLEEWQTEKKVDGWEWNAEKGLKKQVADEWEETKTLLEYVQILLRLSAS